MLPAAIAIVLLALAAQSGSAQMQCTLVRVDALSTQNIGTPFESTSITNGELACPDGSNLSAMHMQSENATQIVTLTGNVRYGDGRKVVTSEAAQYFKTSGVLQARGNVLVTDTETRSTIRAPALDYYRKNDRTPEPRMVTSGGRGNAIIRNRRRLGEVSPGSRGDSTIVDADIIEIIGEREFRGSGNAVITREDMRGYGNVLRYDQDGGEMLLAVAARIESEKYQLEADTIRGFMTEGEELREVRAILNSRLTAEDIRVLSPFLTIHVDSGTVNRLIATRPALAAGDTAGMPRVLSASFNLHADSIDALAPRQRLQRVDAVGHAYGERIDTLPKPPQAVVLPQWLTNDWVRGDVIIATFIEDSAAAARAEVRAAARPDSARRPLAGGADDADAARALETLIVTGSAATPASATLRMPVENSVGEWEFHHTLAERITVEFAKGEVANLDFKGNVRGLYLTSPGRTADSTTRPGGS